MSRKEPNDWTDVNDWEDVAPKATSTRNLNTPERRAAEAAAKTAKYPLKGVETKGNESMFTRASGGLGEGLKSWIDPLMSPYETIKNSLEHHGAEFEKQMREGYNYQPPPSPLGEQVRKIVADPVEGLANTAGMLAPALIPGAARLASERVPEPIRTSINEAPRNAANSFTSADAIRTRAAANRAPLPPTDIATRLARKAVVGGAGQVVGGLPGATAAEAVDLAWQSQPVRNFRAGLQDRAADWMQGGPKPTTYRDPSLDLPQELAPPRPPTPPTPTEVHDPRLFEDRFPLSSPPPVQPDLIIPTPVEVGMEVPVGQLHEFHPSVQALSDAFGGSSSLQKMSDLQKVFNEALPDLKRAQLETVRTPLDTNEKIALTANVARNKVWNESIAPSIQGQVDLSPVGEQMIRELPDSIRLLDNAAYVREVRRIQTRFMNKSVGAKGLHALAKEAGAGVRSALAKNNFDRAAALQTPRGQMANSYNTALRNALWRHVEQTTGVDVRPALSRYGALSDIEQSALKLPKADYSNVARAFDQYEYEPLKSTPAFEPRYAPPERQIGTVAGGARPMPAPETSSVTGSSTPLPRNPRPGDRFMRDDGVQLVFSRKLGWTPRRPGGI